MYACMYVCMYVCVKSDITKQLNSKVWFTAAVRNIDWSLISSLILIFRQLGMTFQLEFLSKVMMTEMIFQFFYDFRKYCPITESIFNLNKLEMTETSLLRLS